MLLVSLPSKYASSFWTKLNVDAIWVFLMLASSLKKMSSTALSTEPSEYSWREVTVYLKSADCFFNFSPAPSVYCNYRIVFWTSWDCSSIFLRSISMNCWMLNPSWVLPYARITRNFVLSFLRSCWFKNLFRGSQSHHFSKRYIAVVESVNVGGPSWAGRRSAKENHRIAGNSSGRNSLLMKDLVAFCSQLGEL